jgi:ATP-dependent protease ClpP protease subunit
MDKQILFKSFEDYLNGRDIEDGIIRIYDDVGAYTPTEIDQKLYYMLTKKMSEATVFFHNCDTGTPYVCFGLYDIISGARKAELKIQGICSGQVCPSVSMIALQACSVRSITSNARILVEEPSKWIFVENSKMSEMEDRQQELKTLTDYVLRILAPRCKKSEEEILKFISRRTRYLGAKEALEFGIIDQII